MGVAGEGDDGDGHEEGFAGGGGAVVGEGVEGDVDLVVGFAVVVDGAEVGVENGVGIRGDAFLSEEVDGGLRAVAADRLAVLRSEMGGGELVVRIWAQRCEGDGAELWRGG